MYGHECIRPNDNQEKAAGGFACSELVTKRSVAVGEDNAILRFVAYEAL